MGNGPRGRRDSRRWARVVQSTVDWPATKAVSAKDARWWRARGSESGGVACVCACVCVCYHYVCVRWVRVGGRAYKTVCACDVGPSRGRCLFHATGLRRMCECEDW